MVNNGRLSIFCRKIYERNYLKYKAAFSVVNYFPHAHTLVQLITNYTYVYIHVYIYIYI